MKQLEKQYNGNLRAQHKEETEAIIFESAKSLFEKSGFEKTTIRAIARNAGVGLGTIFNYFPDKPSLLIAVLLHDLENVEVHTFSTLPKKSNIVEKCIHIAKSYYSYYAKNPSLSRTLIKESNFIGGKFGDLLESRINKFIQLLQDMMIEAQENGEIRVDVDCELVAITFYSLFLSFLFSGLGSHEFDIKESINMIRRLLNQYMNGIG